MPSVQASPPRRACRRGGHRAIEGRSADRPGWRPIGTRAEKGTDVTSPAASRRDASRSEREARACRGVGGVGPIVGTRSVWPKIEPRLRRYGSRSLPAGNYLRGCRTSTPRRDRSKSGAFSHQRIGGSIRAGLGTVARLLRKFRVERRSRPSLKSSGAAAVRQGDGLAVVGAERRRGTCGRAIGFPRPTIPFCQAVGQVFSNAARPARQTSSSSSGLPPETPIAPTTAPSNAIGRPPWSGTRPGKLR